MDLNEAKSFFDGLLHFGVRPGLDGIRALCALLSDPQKQLKLVHVAGTNGKGSVCVELSNAFICQGYKTGLFISPYVFDFRERFMINGAFAPDDLICKAAAEVKDAVDRLRDKNVIITEFEAITAAAFLIFKQAECDVVVLETGLGGRFDATNVIDDPLISVITSISIDHTAVLGNTIQSIAYEKAGIVKAGCPCAVSDTLDPEALTVVKGVCSCKGSELVTSFSTGITVSDESIFGSVILINGNEISVPFPGEHQRSNAVLVCSVCAYLDSHGFDVSPRSVREGIALSKLPARTQIVSRSPLIIFDGAHNAGASSALSDTLGKYLQDKKLLFLVGMMKDKDQVSFFKNLKDRISCVLTVTAAGERAQSDLILRDIASALGIRAESSGDTVSGYRKALSLLYDYDALIVTGSFYMIGELYGFVREK